MLNTDKEAEENKLSVQLSFKSTGMLLLVASDPRMFGPEEGPEMASKEYWTNEIKWVSL